ncbi:MAG: hypothetical protein AAF902_10345 [Chloroflexota bacterium]
MEEVRGIIFKHQLESLFEKGEGKEVLNDLIQSFMMSKAFVSRVSERQASFVVLLEEDLIDQKVRYRATHFIETDFYKFNPEWLKESILESGSRHCLFIEYVPIESPFGGGFYEPDYLHLNKSIKICGAAEIDVVGELRLLHCMESPKGWVE